jgi:hypothetical protein
VGRWRSLDRTGRREERRAHRESAGAARRDRRRTKRDPWERPGGTTFHFVNDGISSALAQAREAAGDRDVDRLTLNQVRTASSTRVTHVTYTVGKR